MFFGSAGDSRGSHVYVWPLPIRCLAMRLLFLYELIAAHQCGRTKRPIDPDAWILWACLFVCFVSSIFPDQKKTCLVTTRLPLFLSLA